MAAIVLVVVFWALLSSPFSPELKKLTATAGSAYILIFLSRFRAFWAFPSLEALEAAPVNEQS